MGPSLMSKQDLRTLVENYANSIAGKPNVTTSCLISLVELRAMITYSDNENVKLIGGKIDGVRIYFTIGDVRNDPNQISLAIVPTINYDDNYKNTGDGGADNYYKRGNTIMCLKPGFDAENSGLCPPNCGGHNL
jgi:hypothetical protein